MEEKQYRRIMFRRNNRKTDVPYASRSDIELVIRF